MLVVASCVSASRARTCSGFMPHARMISLSASTLLTRVFGFMANPALA